MSFAAPWYLLGLVFVPLAAAAYLAVQRRYRRAALAFAAGPVLPSVAPRRAGWRQHVPALFFLGALLGLFVALARPQTTVAVEQERATVVLATDVSGSMQATDVRPNRLVAARDASLQFLDDAPRRLRIGAFAFNQSARALASPSTDRAPLRAALRRLKPSGGTATGEALAAALATVRPKVAGRDGKIEAPPAAIVLLSDGASTKGRDPVEVARQAKELGVPIHTVALGTDEGTITTPQGRVEGVPPDRDQLQEISSITGAEALSSTSTAELATVYERLGSQTATKDEEREITAAFAAGSLLLMLLGGGLSLRWFGRLP